MLVWFLQLVGIAAKDQVTLRAAAAACLALVLALVFGRRVIAWLRARFREPIKSASPTLVRLHGPKSGTPTMGGLFLVAGLLGGAVAFGDLGSPYLWLALAVAVALAALGAVDDLAKLRGPERGLSPRTKLVYQAAIAVAASLVLYRMQGELPGGHEFWLPGGATLPLGWLCVPLTALTIVGSSNAVNLTDGLDGLAGGCVVFAAGALAVLALVAGHAGLAAELHVIHVPGGSEMALVAAALTGAVLGFLWFNCHPAEVFMGNTGSLALGGVLGLIAAAARQEFLWLVIGGVFAVEALSVLVQVASYRTLGRRVWRCAPLHHHFEFAGWPESRIVVRFWIAAALCALLGLGGLRLSVDPRPPAAPHTASAALQVMAR